MPTQAYTNHQPPKGPLMNYTIQDCPRSVEIDLGYNDIDLGYAEIDLEYYELRDTTGIDLGSSQTGWSILDYHGRYIQ